MYIVMACPTICYQNQLVVLVHYVFFILWSLMACQTHMLQVHMMTTVYCTDNTMYLQSVVPNKCVLFVILSVWYQFTAVYIYIGYGGSANYLVCVNVYSNRQASGKWICSMYMM